MKYFSLLFIFLIFSCDKTKVSETKKELPQQNIALLVDNSLTMLAKDFEPNRITIIKDIVKNIIINKKENQAFSIVIFARNSYILCPLTKDKNQLLAAVSKLDSGIMTMSPGTNFSNVLLNGILSLNTELDNKSMILFSDGKENMKSYPLDIPIQDAIKNNIKISTVMITPKDFAILPTSMDMKGNFQFTRQKAEPVDSTQLKKISSETGGTFRIFYTKEEIKKFNFNQLVSENQTVKIKKNSSKINDDKLSKIYKEIKMMNDSLKVIFNK